MTPEQYEAIRLKFIRAAMKGVCENNAYAETPYKALAQVAVEQAEATLKAAGVERPQESDEEALRRGREIFDDNWKAMEDKP